MSGLVYQRYPLAMHHPNATPAVLSPPGSPPGHAAVFPPVTVNNEDQEEYYRSRGYQPINEPNPDAWRTQKTAWQHGGSEYPKWVNGKLVEDPNIKPVSNEYPKWVGAVIVQNAEEEAALRRAEPPAPELAECVAAWADAAGEPTSEPAAEDDMAEAPSAAEFAGHSRAELIAEAERVGVKVFRGWPAEKIAQTIIDAAADREDDREDDEE